MSYGFKIPIQLLNQVEDYCQRRKIEFILWNCEDVFNGDAESASLDFESKHDALIVKGYVDALKTLV